MARTHVPRGSMGVIGGAHEHTTFTFHFYGEENGLGSRVGSCRGELARVPRPTVAGGKWRRSSCILRSSNLIFNPIKRAEMPSV